MPGVEVPHDLALAPAPLQLTGAGASPAFQSQLRCTAPTRCPWAHLPRTFCAVPAPALLFAALSHISSAAAAGERLLAFVIAETRDSGGHNLQKVVLVPAGEDPWMPAPCASWEKPPVLVMHRM